MPQPPLRPSADPTPPCGNSAGEPVIQARGVNHFFGHGDVSKQVVFDNNLQLGSGEFVVMTGPSGSGKTTLLTLIGALRSVQDGSLRVLGRELRGLSRQELVATRRDIGFIFQGHNLFDSLTAYQNVRLAMEVRSHSARAMHELAVEMLTKLGLGHRIDYKPHQLSGGQRQRVAVCRALVNRPRLILADEPTAALDKDAGRDVVNLLKSLVTESRCTVLMVTHDNRIIDAADRIISLVDGRIATNVAIKETMLVCEFLAQCPTFSKLTPATLSDFAARMQRRHFPRGAVVFCQGDQGNEFFLIRSGSVEVVVDDGTSERVMRVLNQGDVFGEMALLSGHPRTATIRTCEATELYALGQADFNLAMEHSSSFREQLLKVCFLRQ